MVRPPQHGSGGRTDAAKAPHRRAGRRASHASGSRIARFAPHPARFARHIPRASRDGSCGSDAKPFDRFDAHASCVICTHALDAIRTSLFEATTSPVATGGTEKSGTRHGDAARSRKERSMDRRLGEEGSITRASFSAPPAGPGPRSSVAATPRTNIAEPGTRRGGRDAGARATRLAAQCATSPAPAAGWPAASTDRRDTGSAPIVTPQFACSRGRRAPLSRRRVTTGTRSVNRYRKDLTE